MPDRNVLIRGFVSIVSDRGILVEMCSRISNGVERADKVLSEVQLADRPK